MTPSDKSFYKALGQRIAHLRKERGLTQVQLAESLGIAQQTMAHYEGGTLRIAVALLKPLCLALNTSIEELLDEPASASSKKRGPTSKLQQQVEQISTMPRSKQKFISEMLDALIAQQKAG
ncbi:MAG: helix-turn-helix domain-containing protein [Gammaproteobacteria bacterium]|nr:helix-turn-helix domain-containing protein [Gammaproteobacteria bacterium]MDH5803372.1 helix-turn-helix domain-containing protein [Gammaproteobacteria bacterium]